MQDPHARIPRWIKLSFTAFMLVLVPTYWANYGPTNFLYFCDVALFLTLYGVWTERTLPLGMAAAGIALPQLLWVVDFAGELLGAPLIGMTSYMFEPQNPLFNRSLSLFHGWLPFLLLWLVWRVGYDRRAFVAWLGTAWALIVICYVWMPPPHEPGAVIDPNLPVNINYVYGLDGRQPWMPEVAWLCVWMLAQPLLLVGPTHLLLTRFAPAPRG
jgi:hypothetical protein